MEILPFVLIFLASVVHRDIMAAPLLSNGSLADVAFPSNDPEFSTDEFEGDMVSFSVIPNMTSGQNTAVSDPDKRWKFGIIPYVIDKSYSFEEIQMMLLAFNTFQENTCVRFVPRCDGDPDQATFFGCGGPDYIFIVPGDGCSSNVGRQKGVQKVTLMGKTDNSNGCFTPNEPGRVMHELLHALGFIHEQTRKDRDQFIKIDFSNIPQGNRNINFQVYADPTDSFGEAYDYGSVMHYPKSAFAKNPTKETITPLITGQEIGQRRNLSAVDIRKVNKAYEKECAERLEQPGGSAI